MIQSIIKNKLLMKQIVAFTFVLMILVNALANILPINGVSTGSVSDYYANLFAPAGITFIIWAVIYLNLGGYVVFQFKTIFYSPETAAMIQKMRFWFSLSSVANTLWILCWHYDQILLSLLLMGVILISLIKCNLLIHTAKLTAQERRWVQMPFSLYFGWITVATIANVTTVLVKFNWNGFGLREDVITSVIIIVGLLIGIRTILKFKDLTYGLVIVWAYFGILLKHIEKSGFAWEYPIVIYTVIFSLVILGVSMSFVSHKWIEHLKAKYRN